MHLFSPRKQEHGDQHQASFIFRLADKPSPAAVARVARGARGARGASRSSLSSLARKPQRLRRASAREHISEKLSVPHIIALSCRAVTPRPRTYHPGDFQPTRKNPKYVARQTNKYVLSCLISPKSTRLTGTSSGPTIAMGWIVTAIGICSHRTRHG